MQPKPVFYFALITLALAGAWGLLHINNQGIDNEQGSAVEKRELVADQHQSSDFEHSLSNHIDRAKEPSAKDDNTSSNFNSIFQLVDSGQALKASNAINDRYSSLSSTELESLKSALLALVARSKSTSRKKDVLLAISKAFDDLDVWAYLGDTAMSDNDWNTAFSANFRASELENNPTDLDILLKKLVISSSHLRSSLEDNGDLLSIKSLYQRLTDLHPNFQRFQYELAISKLNLGETDNAKQLLQLLIYDPELGDISQQTLSRIESQSSPKPEQNETVARKPQTNNRANDIVVPLISVGSSFIVDSTVKRRSVRLLLDTGASITSFSSELIARLKLQPTGQSIRLSTANGLTSARIYRVEQLRLGSLVLRDMLIAEIALGSNRNFQGLLGTDALNKLKPQYSYLIDNQQNALIFRKR